MGPDGTVFQFRDVPDPIKLPLLEPDPLPPNGNGNGVPRFLGGFRRQATRGFELVGRFLTWRGLAALDTFAAVFVITLGIAFFASNPLHAVFLLLQAHQYSAILGVLGKAFHLAVTTALGKALQKATIVAGVEFLTKALLQTGHEILWMQPWFKKAMEKRIPNETLKRVPGFKKAGKEHYDDLRKALSWRFIGTMDTLFVSGHFSGSSLTAVLTVLWELFTKTALSYVHERAWRKGKAAFSRNKPANIAQKSGRRAMASPPMCGPVVCPA